MAAPSVLFKRSSWTRATANATHPINAYCFSDLGGPRGDILDPATWRGWPVGSHARQCGVRPALRSKVVHRMPFGRARNGWDWPVRSRFHRGCPTPFTSLAARVLATEPP